MLNWFLRIVVSATTVWQRVCLAFDRTRRLTLWGLLHFYGRRRDMLYLHNGGWIDLSPAIEPEQVAFFYDSERHRLRTPSESIGDRCDRWKWLSAVERDGQRRDLTPWLEGLRVPRGREDRPLIHVLLGLFAQQNGWMPRGVLTVTMRDGNEEQISVEGPP